MSNGTLNCSRGSIRSRSNSVDCVRLYRRPEIVLLSSKYWPSLIDQLYRAFDKTRQLISMHLLVRSCVALRYICLVAHLPIGVIVVDIILKATVPPLGVKVIVLHLSIGALKIPSI